MTRNNQDTERRRSSHDASTAKAEAEYAYNENIASEEEDEEWNLTFGKLLAMLVS
jgi:hypothetical protein